MANEQQLREALKNLLTAIQETPATDEAQAEQQNAQISLAVLRAESLVSSWDAQQPATGRSTVPQEHEAYSRYLDAVTTEPVEDGIRNAEDELSCAEEVLDAITCEFSDGEFPVTDFNCIGDYITAVVDVFKERLAAQQPATGEPVVEPMALYNKVESKIVQRYVVEKRTGGGFWPYCVRACGGEREIFVGHKVACENVRAALQTACLDGAFMADIAARSHPAPSVPKDHQIAALVNKVRDIARMFHDHQSLRERIAIELVPALNASQEVKSNAERWRHAISDGGNQSMSFIDIFNGWDGDGDFVEVFDAAMLAAKERP